MRLLSYNQGKRFRICFGFVCIFSWLFAKPNVNMNYDRIGSRIKQLGLINCEEIIDKEVYSTDIISLSNNKAKRYKKFLVL